MSKLRTLITTLWISVIPLANQSSRALTYLSETGSAKPVAAAATGVVAGGTLMAVLSRACRSTARLSSRTAVGVAERAAFTMSERSALGASIALAEADELGIAAMRASNWKSFSGVIKETEVAKGLDDAALLLKWQKDPEFRAKIFGELARKKPETLLSLSDDMLDRYSLLSLENKPTLQSAIKSQPVDLYDSTGNVLSKDLVSVVEAEYNKKATEVLGEALKRVPSSSYKSEAALKTALKEAFESTELTRKSGYSFDVSSGRLELKFQSKYGEIKGRINAYNVAVLIGPLGAGNLLLQNPLDDGQAPGRTHSSRNPGERRRGAPF
jgi:hypothetical protein